MKPNVIWANLAVKDLERTTKFYKTLGFKHKGTQAGQLTSFSFGKNSFIINFFLKKVLETNGRSKIASTKPGNEVIFTLSAKTRKEIDDWVTLAKKAGGKITVKPYTIGTGCTFVFADPDGHKFNILLWPGM